MTQPQGRQSPTLQTKIDLSPVGYLLRWKPHFPEKTKKVKEITVSGI